MIETLELPFSIENADPATFPMARLADYIGELAKLFGSEDQVHFGEIRSGSTVIVSKIEQSARPLVLPRLRAAARGEGVPDAARAWHRLNARLTEDASKAALRLPGGEVIIFPGLPKAERPIGPIRQPTSLQGRLVRLEGTGDVVSVGIDDDPGIAGKITVPAAVAKELGAHFQRYVRLSGMGRWKRTAEGRWQLERLDADAFEILDETPLADVIRRVREFIPHGSGAVAIREIDELGSA